MGRGREREEGGFVSLGFFGEGEGGEGGIHISRKIRSALHSL